MEMFFLSYVNETTYLLWNLPFFKMVPPKTNFWLITAQQTSIHINCLTAGGWHTLCRPLSKTHVWAVAWWDAFSLRRLCHLISNLPREENTQLQPSRGHSFCPLLMSCHMLSLALLYFNKTLLHKTSERSSLVTGPRQNSSPPEAKKPGVFHSSTTTFHFYFCDFCWSSP